MFLNYFPILLFIMLVVNNNLFNFSPQLEMVKGRNDAYLYRNKPTPQGKKNGLCMCSSSVL